MNTLSTSARRRVVPLGVLFLLAFGIRLVYVVELQSNASPDVYSFLDQMENRYWARTILAGDLLGQHARFPEDVFYRNHVFFKPPLYPYALAGLLWIFRGSIVAVQVVQALVSAVSVVLVSLLTRRFGMPHAASYAAGTALAVYGPHIFLSGQLLPETFYVTASLALLLQVDGFAGRPSSRSSILLGVGFGVCALLRPNILAFLPFATAWLWASLRKKTSTTQLSYWGFLGLASLGLVILPVTARNYWAGGEPVIISYYSGYNFYAGNNDECRAGMASHEMPTYHEAIKSRAEELRRPLRASELSSLGWSMGLDFVGNHPGQAASLLLNKGYRALNAYEPMSNQDVYLMRRFSRVLAATVWRVGSFSWPLGVVMPLALLGCVLAIKDRRGELGVLYLLAGGGGMLLFFVTFRHRLPMVPVLLIMAVYAVHRLSRPAGWTRKGRTASIITLLLFSVVVNSRWDGIDIAAFDKLAGERLISSYLNAAAARCEVGDYGRAISLLERAVAIEPASDRLETALAGLLAAVPDAALRDGPRALSMARDVYDRGHQGEALFTVAMAFAESGEFGKAVAVLDHLLEIERGNAESRIVDPLANQRRLYVEGRPYRLPRRTIVHADSEIAVPKWTSHLPPWFTLRTEVASPAD